MGEGLEQIPSRVSQIQEIVSWLLFLKCFYSTSQDFYVRETLESPVTPSRVSATLAGAINVLCHSQEVLQVNK